MYSFTTKVSGDLLTIRGNTIQEFSSNLEAAAQSGIGATISQMVTSVNNTGALNSVLGATPVDPPQNPEPPQQAAPPQQDAGPWGQAPQQGQWGQQGGGQPPQQGGSNWGQPPAQQQGGWGGAPQGGGAPAGDAPINPFTGQPMLYKEGVSKKTGKPYKMWVDERPWAQVKDLPDSQKAQAQFIR